MSTTYPTTKQSIPNPTGTDLLENATATLDHDYQHSTLNDTIEALQDKVGVDGSATTTTHDYKLSGVTGSDKAVSKTGTETLTNKTLTAPQVNFGGDATGDMYYRNGSGVTARLPIGTAGQIIQVSASGIPEYIANPAATDASTTVKGVVEEATLAETLARTTAGGTSARLFVNPSTLTTVQTYDYAASSAGSDTYAITVTPAPTAYATGQVFRFKADVANTGAATLNVNGLGAKTIVKNVSSTLITGDIDAGKIIEVVYDGTNMVMQSPTAAPALYSTGQTSRASATGTGTQTIAHGLGVTPRMIVINYNGHCTSNAADTIGTGTATSTSSENCSYSVYQNLPITRGQNNAAIIVVQNDASTDMFVATVSALDATNITLDFTTNTGGGTVYIQWQAFA